MNCCLYCNQPLAYISGASYQCRNQQCPRTGQLYTAVPTAEPGFDDIKRLLSGKPLRRPDPARPAK